MRLKTLTFLVCFATALLMNTQLADAQDLSKLLTPGGEFTPEAQKALRQSLEFKTLTPEEIEQALVQAHEVYGFGLEGIEGDTKDSGQVREAVLFGDLVVEDLKESTVDFEEIDEDDETSISGSGTST